MPGDAADDYYDACERIADIEDRMHEAGCRRCLHAIKDTSGSCLVCDDLGWLDRDGNPVEP